MQGEQSYQCKNRAQQKAARDGMAKGRLGHSKRQHRGHSSSQHRAQQQAAQGTQ